METINCSDCKMRFSSRYNLQGIEEINILRWNRNIYWNRNTNMSESAFVSVRSALGNARNAFGSAGIAFGSAGGAESAESAFGSAFGSAGIATAATEK